VIFATAWLWQHVGQTLPS